MSTPVGPRPPPPARTRPAETDTHPGTVRRGGAIAGVVLLMLVAVAAWVPFLHRSLTSDESGFLLLAQQWRPGRSLYGDLWVDRPPLLIWLFAAAGHLGSSGATTSGFVAPGVKALGAVAAGLSVGLAGILARLLAPATQPGRRTCVVLAAVLLSDPLLAMPEVDGELLALPFVLLGLVCGILALRGRWGWRTAALAVGAGAAGTAAALVKQNVVDVFVFVTILAACSRDRTDRLDRTDRTDRIGARAAAFVAGAAAVLVAALGGSWVQGTTVTGLWNAVVLFRGQAAAVIDSSSTAANLVRSAQLGAAALGSGVVLVLVAASAAALTRRSALTWAALGMTAWEIIAILAGGSYWLHYLTGIVPGLVVLVATVHPGLRARRLLTHVVAFTVAATLTVWTYLLLAPTPVTPEAQVSTYLRQHARPSDGVVVGFGHAEIVAASGLRTPYENMWSLPVRVRDRHLVELHDVLAGTSAPRWVVVDGSTLDTWGVDGDNAQQYLVRHYVEQVSFDNWHVWRRSGRAGR